MRGFSLIEVMVASTVGLILLAGVTALMVNSSTSYRTTDSISRLQENARFAIEFVARDLRNAGNFGCTSDLDTINSTLNAWMGLSALTTPNPIEGLEAGTTKWYPSGSTVIPSRITALAGKGGDAILIRYLDSNAIRITQDMPNESGNLFVNPGHGLVAGDIVMVADCDSADIIQITGVNTAGGGTSGDGLVHNSGNGVQCGTETCVPGNSTQKLQKIYGADARVFKVNNFQYYIGTGASGRLALFRGDQELVEGIENLQVLYGVDSNDKRMPTKYLRANQISAADWRNVVSVRVALLASTIANTETGETGTEYDKKTYDLNLTPSDTTDDVDPDDRKVVRQEFYATVNLRNIR